MLVLTPATRDAIHRLTERAHLQPYTPAHTRKHFHTPLPDRSLTVPHGHKVILTVGQYRPGWICRRLEVTGPDVWPALDDVCRLMAMAWFRSPLEQCLTWPAGLPSRRTVNILEPLDLDWAPLRNA